ncbi:MAG: type I DNA topoisomerase [Fimbriimonadaceae bacterium]|nr:type I DNA topoisomerase [Fimbriimonadaceae bacterium]
MPKKLVIVESPAKAKTISRFLGSDYVVQASLGHVRDLPDNRKGLPTEHQKKWWADYAVDVDNNFEPFYQVSSGKQKTIDSLKSALKGADELILATDEDREGESISWHLLEILKPSSKVKVSRIAFHEITREAIQEALQHPRQIDSQLVEAQEARRILDRLYGYTLSPVLWSKVAKELSAGRVQSPAVKLIVEREKRRRDFKVSVYWDLKAGLSARDKGFDAILRKVDGTRIAQGKDFDDESGQLVGKNVRLLNEEETGRLAEAAREAKPWTVTSVEKNPGIEKPPAPFRTTTLQQEANRKFGMSADRTMRIAQDLYEGVDIGGGERVGLITYMRTDSLSLAEQAVREIRTEIENKFGEKFIPAKPNRYESKVANAQEAHEAIRPTDIHRTAESLRSQLMALSESHYKLYDLIYKRTLACQMRNAEVMRTSAEIEVATSAGKLTFGATGKEITFPGFLLAYVEDLDDADAAIEEKERILPELNKGDETKLVKLDTLRHETKAPARYTEATLIKALEELGIGRPSTYASIMSVIVDRGYVRKKGRELIPTFVAFMTVELLDNFFAEFMDLRFTAQMDERLDQIARGEVDGPTYLKRFFLGADGQVGLREAVSERKTTIPFANYNLGAEPESGKPIIVRIGKGGDPFLQIGDGDEKRYANVPEDVSPAELSIEKALALFDEKRPEAESIGVDPASGKRLLVKFRTGYYLELERTPEELEAKVKPTWISLPPNTDPRTLSPEDLAYLCELPKQIGLHPETKEPVIFRIGKFGPYLQCGAEIRNVEDWRAAQSLSLDQAVEILKQPKTFGRAKASTGPIQEFGALEGAAGPVRVLAGRFGPYVTDGTTNATLPKGTDPATITPEAALELLKAKAAAGPSTKKFSGRRGKASAAKGKSAGSKAKTKGGKKSA